MGSSASKVKERVLTAQKTRNLNLSDLGLDEVPIEKILEISKLATLSLDRNNIKSLPDNLSKLDAIKLLSLNFNKITVLGPVVCGMKSLTTLRVTHNRLTSLPVGLSSLPALREISASFNGIKTLPSGIFTGPATQSLRVIDLSSNGITEFPASILEASGLQELRLDSNSLATLPDNWTSLKNIKCLSVSHNKLTSASLPVSLFVDTQLNTFTYEGNIVTPEEIRAHPGYQQWAGRATASINKQIAGGLPSHLHD